MPRLDVSNLLPLRLSHGTLQELALHTTPLAIAAWRLIPAGALVILWAQLAGRKQPDSWKAWLAIMLFGIVDGACFQVSSAGLVTFMVAAGTPVKHGGALSRAQPHCCIVSGS